jgi:hypothetical protein
MSASGDGTTRRRSGLARLISPWEYKHLNAVANVRFVSGGFQLGVGLCLLGLARKAESDQDRRKMYQLSGWFLVPAALNLLGGCVDTIAARTAPPRT